MFACLVKLAVDVSIYMQQMTLADVILDAFMRSSLSTYIDPLVLGHFGHGHLGLGLFGLDISATDISATENAEGGRFGQNHKFCVWDVCMHKCVMHFLIF